MTPITIDLNSQPMQSCSNLNSVVSELQDGATWLSSASLTSLKELVDACGQGVMRSSKEWVRTACEAKKIGADQPISAEEVLAGPATLLRYLRILSKVLQDVEGTFEFKGTLSLNSELSKHVLQRAKAPAGAIMASFPANRMSRSCSIAWRQFKPAP